MCILLFEKQFCLGNILPQTNAIITMTEKNEIRES